MSGATGSSSYAVNSTAGAVPVRNEKGEISMRKVKVHRYISGKRPEYANYNSSDEESDEDDFLDHRGRTKKRETVPENNDDAADTEMDIDDPRLRRLNKLRELGEDLSRERQERHRHIHEPEILNSSSSEDEDSRRPTGRHEEEEDDDDDNMGLARLADVRREIEAEAPIRQKIRLVGGSDSESDNDNDLSDTEIERRRQLVRFKLLQQQKEQEELLAKEEEKSESEEEETSSEEETEESEDEENEPRLKPLFVRKRDRTTVGAKDVEQQLEKQQELEEKRMAKERRRAALRLVEESVKKDLEKAKPESNEPQLNDVCTDDENDEVEYEAWKLRELKRIKRDRDEKEALERERLEAERLRNMTEEERKAEARINPKTITNKAAKGKYKFLQKYYHRGVFYLDQEDEVFKRDYSGATLEDHFDKTVLPKVMQVKNFGRCGRTKYTHLVDQDTTNFDSAWHKDSANAMKFHMERAGGMKQVFERPSASKRKKPSS